VPWCTTCDRFLSPSTVTAKGKCPTCGAGVDPGKAQTPEAAEKKRSIPWHFKALIGVFVLYLGYRAGQGIEWLVDNL
jgi:hypothetical protein